ncbi:hypothetical protein WICPIJ_010002 [Wickerhamomyces pijperi]|uniref:Uncharacterized protein n=1 Tax=Wickerhamomyces pijperi TaxID=599730 RepID=A0A9P8TC58_WICPI|nr:hypothetical protein WICPIJ_010002 [Wickerhamomyces pijperi]
MINCLDVMYALTSNNETFEESSVKESEKIELDVTNSENGLSSPSDSVSEEAACNRSPYFPCIILSRESYSDRASSSNLKLRYK